MKATIYKIENLKTSDCYIGFTTNYSRRKKRHFQDLAKGCHHSVILQRAFNKYGVCLFRIYVLESFTCSTKEEMLAKEQYYIDTVKPVYNICKVAGSQLGSKRSEEFKQNCSERMKGKLAWNKGLKTGKQSKETVEKRMASRKGKKLSEKTKKKISEAHKGRVFSEEHKQKLKDAAKRRYSKNKSDDS